jgi:AcrR family transcriptional regulator
MTAAPVDRAAAVRDALRTLVARNGFHGASMSAIARQAAVATGTAYTHYASKDELVLAAYCETKAQLAAAAMAGLDARAEPAAQFRSIWLATYRHLKANPEHALFLLQVDHSPHRGAAHQAAIAVGDPLVAHAARPDVAVRLLPLPLEVIYELGLSPAVRLAAAGTELTDEQLNEIASACWRAISPGTSPLCRKCPECHIRAVGCGESSGVRRD